MFHRSHRSLGRQLAKIGIAATLLFASSVATAQGTDEALARFERGVQLYEAQNFEGALVEFTAAYKLTENYKLLYNIGICQQQSREYVAAGLSTYFTIRWAGSGPSKSAAMNRLYLTPGSVGFVRSF